MNRIPEHEAPLVGVLDIETGLDPIAAGLVGGTRAGLAGKVALHRVRAATLLTARTDGDTVEVVIRSWHVDPSGEDEVVAAIDADLAALGADGGRLATFNGRRHDLPVLRRRLAAHMRFDGRGVWSWLGRDAPHVDIMTDAQPAGAKWASLQEEAAGLGIAMPAAPSARDPAGAARQSEIDCATTYLVYLHLIAGATGNGRPLLAGWRGLAAAIAREANLAHLRPLAKPAALPTPL